MKKSSAFDIAIVPSNAVKKLATRLSRALKKHGGLFVLNERLYSSHVTLYMVELPLQNLSEVQNILRKIAINQKSFIFKPLFWNQSRDGYIDVEYRKTKFISNLQKKVVQEVNPLREGLLRKKDIARLTIASGPEKRNIKKYGFRSVDVNFKPHLTLTKLPAYKLGAIPKISPQNMSFRAREIGIFYLGEHGSCKKLVAKYRFGAN